MKASYKTMFWLLMVFSSLVACNNDDEGDPNFISHTGEKWNITSVEYDIIEQSTSGQTFKSGTEANAGAFYFDGAKGTFNILIDNIHKEDYFSFSQNGSDVSIVTISQSVGGGGVSQHVISLSGQTSSATTMTVDGTITKQSAGGQFVMTATFTLEKE